MGVYSTTKESVRGQVFENSLWLFLTNPFDVGDTIVYDGKRYSIKSIKLQKVGMTRFDGADVMISTDQMRSSLIHNLSRYVLVSAVPPARCLHRQGHVSQKFPSSR